MPAPADSRVPKAGVDSAAKTEVVTLEARLTESDAICEAFVPNSMRSSSTVLRTRREAYLRLHQSRGDCYGSAQHGDRFDRRKGPVGSDFQPGLVFIEAGIFRVQASTVRVH
jgi:hypothetical protein